MAENAEWSEVYIHKQRKAYLLWSQSMSTIMFSISEMISSKEPNKMADLTAKFDERR